jgi:CubicO group peptidase (beta-lactamase class C family)
MHTLTSVLVLSLALLRASTALATTYPEQDWESVTPESTGLNAANLKALSDYTFSVTDHRKTDALVVIHQGKLVFEKYNFGYHAQMKHLSWSMAKSVTTLLAGIAESDGLVSRSMKLNEVFPYKAATPEEQSRRDQITLLSLLTMTSGLDWNEDYSKKKPLNSDVIQMLYMNPRYNMAAYTASRAVVAKPGDRYYYSTGNTTLAMAMLKAKMDPAVYSQYPWKRLFDRIGMKNVTFEQDASGVFGGGSYVYATARDYARLGYLLLNNGAWKDDQVVPTEWMKVIKTLNPGQANGSIAPSSTKTYGTGFWLNVPAPKWNLPVPFPKAPKDLFFALGHNGQSIAVIPSQDLVVVRLAHDTEDEAGSGVDLNDYFGLILSSVKHLPEHVVETRSVGNKPIIRNGPEAFSGELPVPAVKHTSPVYITKLVAAVRAKDFCSCHFVEGQSVEFCEAKVKNGFPQIRMSVSETNQAVTFGIAPSQTARLISPELGCQLY